MELTEPELEVLQTLVAHTREGVEPPGQEVISVLIIPADGGGIGAHLKLGFFIPFLNLF